MAGNAESRQVRRLSVRAATEPLPTPLPPPPRRSRSLSGLDGEPQQSNLHAVPPRSHFVRRVPASDAAQLQTPATLEPGSDQSAELQDPTFEQPVPERSLASPGVIVALTASVAVMCAIGWYEKHGVEGFKWDALKSIVQQWTIEPAVSEEDLPYITAVPLTPNSGGTESIATDEAPSKKTDQMLLSDLLKDESPATSDDDRTQLR